MSEIALIGKKIGMTREFYKTGQLVPVTVLKVEKARVIQIIDEDKRGYKAVQLGFGKVKNSKLTKSMKGYFSKKNTEPKKKLKEFRVDNLENYKEGNEFGLEIFKDINYEDKFFSTVVVLEVDQNPPQEIIDKIVNDCNISEKNLTTIIITRVLVARAEGRQRSKPAKKTHPRM